MLHFCCTSVALLLHLRGYLSSLGLFQDRVALGTSYRGCPTAKVQQCNKCNSATATPGCCTCVAVLGLHVILPGRIGKEHEMGRALHARWLQPSARYCPMRDFLHTLRLMEAAEHHSYDRVIQPRQLLEMFRCHNSGAAASRASRTVAR